MTRCAPWPAVAGGHQRTNHLYRALSSLGRVDTAVLGEPIDPAHGSVLRERFGLVCHFAQAKPGAGWADRWKRTLLSRAWPSLGVICDRYRPDPQISGTIEELVERNEYQAIVSSYLEPLVYSGGFLFHPTICDVDDLDCEAHLTQLATTSYRLQGRMRIRLEARLIKRFLLGYVRHYDHVWVTKRQDARVLRGIRTSILPNIPMREGSVEALPPVSSQVILFVGGLNYPVNVRALDRFVVRVWPRVRAECPEAAFHIVGSHGHPSQSQRWEATPGVRVVGFIEDVRAAYGEAAFSVCPIHEGAGTKIKVSESLLHGRTCVVSSHSHRGYEDVLPDGQVLLVGKTDEAIADRCIELLRDPARRDRLARAGKDAVEEHLSFAAFERRVRETLLPFLERSKAGGRPSAGTHGHVVGGSPAASRRAI